MAKLGPYVPPEWALVLLQSDARIAGVFLRRDTGEWRHSPRLPWFLALLTTIAAPVWLWAFSRISGFASIAAYLTANPLDSLAWWVFPLVVFAASWPQARENRRRAREEREILPTTFVGWPRLMNLRAYAGATGMEQRRMWSQVTRRHEPLLGLTVAGAVAVVCPSLGSYIGVNVLLLWIDSAQIAKAARDQRITLLNAMARQAFLQRLLEELEGRFRRRQTAVGWARSLVGRVRAKFNGR